MAHSRNSASAAPYAVSNMNEEDVVRDERLLESCHHVHVKNMPMGYWVFSVGHLAISVASFVMLIVLVARGTS